MKKATMTLFAIIIAIVTLSAQTVFDNFERTTLGTNWTVFAGAADAGLVNSSDLGFPSQGYFAIVGWTGTSFTANQYSETGFSPNKNDSMLCQVFVRRRASDGARYGFHWNNAYNGRWEIKYDGVPTAQTRILASMPGLFSPAPGDTLRIEIQGMTIKGYHNGNLLLTATDTAYITSFPITATGSAGVVFRFTTTVAPTFPMSVCEWWKGGNYTTTGIQEPSIENNVSVYPNPFCIKTTLTANENLENATLTIYNAAGQQVKQIKNISGQTIMLYRDNLSSGLYFISLSQDNKFFMKGRLVVRDN